MAKPPTTRQSRPARFGEDGILAINVGPSDLGALSGSQNQDFQLSILNNMIGALWLPGSMSNERRDECVNGAIAALQGLAPQDEAEGLLAAQMVATHNAAMECLRRAMLEGQTLEGREANLKQAVRLTNSYVNLLGALNKHRGRGQQKIIVEHVTVEAGGQAIVGSVQTGDRRQSNLVHEDSHPRSATPMGEGQADGQAQTRAQGAIGRHADAVMVPEKSAQPSPVRKA